MLSIGTQIYITIVTLLLWLGNRMADAACLAGDAYPVEVPSSAIIGVHATPYKQMPLFLSVKKLTHFNITELVLTFISEEIQRMADSKDQL